MRKSQFNRQSRRKQLGVAVFLGITPVVATMIAVPAAADPTDVDPGPGTSEVVEAPPDSAPPVNEPSSPPAEQPPAQLPPQEVPAQPPVQAPANSPQPPPAQEAPSEPPAQAPVEVPAEKPPANPPAESTKEAPQESSSSEPSSKPEDKPSASTTDEAPASEDPSTSTPDTTESTAPSQSQSEQTPSEDPSEEPTSSPSDTTSEEPSSTPSGSPSTTEAPQSEGPSSSPDEEAPTEQSTPPSPSETVNAPESVESPQGPAPSVAGGADWDDNGKKGSNNNQPPSHVPGPPPAAPVPNLPVDHTPPRHHQVPPPNQWKIPAPNVNLDLRVNVNVNTGPEWYNNTDVAVVVTVYENGDINRPYQIPIAPHSRRAMDRSVWRPGTNYTWTSVAVNVHDGNSGTNVSVGVSQYTYAGGGAFGGTSTHIGIYVQVWKDRPAVRVDYAEICGDQLVVYDVHRKPTYVRGNLHRVNNREVWVPAAKKAYATNAATPYEQRSTAPTTVFLGGISASDQAQAPDNAFISSPWVKAGGVGAIIILAMAAIVAAVQRRKAE